MHGFDLERARAAFPITEKWIHLNHGGVAPMSGPAREAVLECARDACENSTVNTEHWTRIIEKGRVRFAQMIGARSTEIAYIKNTSHGLLIAANGLPISPGDNVVFCRGEFPANAYPWLALRRKGIEVRVVEPERGRIDADLIRAAIDSHTKVVALSFVQFGTGFRADLAPIGELCRARGVYFVVDMIQGVGAMPLDVVDCGIDFAAADAHKWLLGPEGIGFAYCRREVLDDLGLSYVGWHSVASAWDFDSYDMTLRDDARRLEEGSPTQICAVGAATSVGLLQSWGIESIHARIMALTDRIIENARTRGFEVLSPIESPSERSGIIIFRPGGADPKALASGLLESGVIAAARGGGLRFSPHAYNTLDEVDEAFVRLDSGLAKRV